MNITALYPTLPPVLDGIAAYTAHQCAEMARHGETVDVLTRTGSYTPIPGVSIRPCYDGGGRSLLDVLPTISATTPDWLLLQYNPSSYRGRWVINPFLPYLIYRIRQVSPQTRIAIVVHETFAPNTAEFRVRALWERVQLYLLGQCADLLVHVASVWKNRLRGWFPNVPSLHLPVGSNINRRTVDRQAERALLGIDDETVAIGLFGGIDRFKLPDFYRTVAERMAATNRPYTFLYVGGSGADARAVLGSAPLIDCGPLPDADVAARFAVMDVYLTPFENGVTTRRGSFMAGLHHGCPTVTTLGPATDPVLQQAADSAFLAADHTAPAAYADTVVALAADASRRRALGRGGVHLYQRAFDWTVTVPQLLETMQAITTADPSPSSASPPPLAAVPH